MTGREVTAWVRVDVVPIDRGQVRYDLAGGGEWLTDDEIVRVLRGAADAVEARAAPSLGWTRGDDR